MSEITKEEKNSILFYQGGGKNIKLSFWEQGLRDFYGVEDAYMALNALLMPGISNERARLKNENKKFDCILLRHMDELGRDLAYENEDRMSENVLNQYINRFKEIIKKDNQKGLGNSAITTKYLDSNNDKSST